MRRSTASTARITLPNSERAHRTSVADRRQRSTISRRAAATPAAQWHLDDGDVVQRSDLIPETKTAASLPLSRDRLRSAWLAMRAMERRALADPRLADRMAADAARQARPPIDEIAELKVAGGAVRADVIAQRAATLGDRRIENEPNGVDELRKSWLRQPTGSDGRSNTRAKQRLVGVDVSHTSDDVIVHQRELDRRASFARDAPQVIGIECWIERLGPERVEKRMAVCRRCDPQHRAEAPRIAVAKNGAIVERDVDMIVQRARRWLAPDAQRSCHAEVNEHRTVARAKQQVLAAPVDAIDDRALERFRKFGGNRPAQPPVVHVDPHDAPADHVRRDTAPRRFYFRKLGHGTVGAPPEPNVGIPADEHWRVCERRDYSLI